jgi:AcrR family transcriptional regulator
LSAASPREGSHRARKGEGARLRDQILDATEDLLYARGSIDAVSIRAIAARVGVTPPAIYLHFEDKDQLFYAVCRRGFDHFADRLGPVLSSEGSAIERLRRLGEEYVRFGLDHWQQYPILFGLKARVRIPAHQMAEDPGLRILAGLVALVEEAMAEEEIVSDQPPATVAALLWAAAHGAVELLIGTRTNPELVRVPPPEELIPALFDALVGGLTPPT